AFPPLPVLCFSSQLAPSFSFFFQCSGHPRDLPSFPTRRSSDLQRAPARGLEGRGPAPRGAHPPRRSEHVHPPQRRPPRPRGRPRSEEHTSELQSLTNLVCRLLLEKKKQQTHYN